MVGEREQAEQVDGFIRAIYAVANSVSGPAGAIPFEDGDSVVRSLTEAVIYLGVSVKHAGGCVESGLCAVADAIRER